MPVLASDGPGNDGSGLVVGSTLVAGIGPSSAMVSGELTTDDNAQATVYWFEFGPTTAYGAHTPSVTIEDGGERIAVSALLNGLDPSTSYHVRLVGRGRTTSRKGAAATFTTTAAPSDPTDPAGPDASAPVQGKVVVATPVEGTVTVRAPGADTFTTLSDEDAIPVGSVIDARNGTIDLSSVHAGGPQTGRFWGAKFAVRQRATGSGTTEIHLRGGSFAGCRRGATGLAQAARKHKKRVRALWGKDSGGRFRTHGRDSVATVRGTTWQVVDRCDGTLTRVTEGSVEVRNRHSRKRVLVPAGRQYLALHR
jgi:hypothetical protein